MNKKVVVVVPGSDESSELREANIGPGTKVEAVLAAAGLDAERWQIQLRRGDRFESLASGDDLYARVEDGEKVFAVLKDMPVG